MDKPERGTIDDVRMRGFARRQTVDAALAWLDAQLRPLRVEVVPLQTADGRVLATSVASDVDVPGFDRATMDGYAVVAESTENREPARVPASRESGVLSLCLRFLRRPGDSRARRPHQDVAVPFDARRAGASDAVAAVKDDAACVMVSRNQGSGTRALIDRLLQGVRPAGYPVQPRNHHAVAAAIVQRRADWGVTLDTIARNAGLGFLPLREERYDFVVPRLRAHRPAVLAFRRLLTEPCTREALARLGMRVPA